MLGVGEDVVASLVILGVSEHLGVKLPLGVVGLGEELVPKVCSVHQLRLEGTCDTVQAGVLVSLIRTGLLCSFLEQSSYVHA